MNNKIECRDCGEYFSPVNNKPGYWNQCLDCATDVPVYLAQEGSDDTGVVEHFGIVNVYEKKKEAQSFIRSRGEHNG